MLDESLVEWDNKTLNYDLDKYNWPAWALSVIQEVAPKVTALETIHEELTPSEVSRAAGHMAQACSRRDFMEKFDQFVAEYASPRIQNRRYLIQRQTAARIVIPDQAKVGRRLQWHQGVFVGNGRGLRTFWTPVTKAQDTNTMWMMDLDISRKVTRQFLQEKWSLQRFEDECLKHAWPINLKPGQSHLFFQEHLHGNVNNTEGYTRVAFDMRILLEGGEYNRKLPGGYFRLPGDYEAGTIENYTGKVFVTYANWDTEFSRGIPFPMQRAIIEAYCKKRNIDPTDAQFENEHATWLPSLEHFIKERPDGIVLTSMYNLPDNVDRRNELLQLALDLGVELHFANELVSLQTAQDLEKIKTYMSFAVRRGGPESWEIE